MAKRLIVCCDGTWSVADQSSDTNVAKVAWSIQENDDQLVYHKGGADTRRWEPLRGGSVGLSRSILDAYSFLIDKYEPSDQLFVFGFSRGAYTARSLVGLVRSAGILRRENASRIDEAWFWYRSRTDPPDAVAPTLFRQAYAHQAGIHFIGVWDTVGPLGIPSAVPGSLYSATIARLNRRWAFHDTELSMAVKGAFHALAIDEERDIFRPTLWRQQPRAADSGQELKQVWFTGAHADVGGGSPKTGLSDISLLWMTAQAARYGLEFDATKLNTPDPGAMPEDTDTSLVNPDVMAPVNAPQSGMRKTALPLHRPIGAASNPGGDPDTCEYISDTAKRRFEKDKSYRPPGLVQYLSSAETRIERVPLP
ncbi:DUF2235 domain-containing protein [Streptomyces sp. KM273126]|uniref:DUF2235 domain-containing protein n=1 Tax=Streptomyces sp. KM273126 TaxID=2545247 RepID=UPI00103CE477|nr:DUF2235 domain-containing protein [Streptomyces sp. KM273126]MBA2811460.1 DUF2235 domain-containing protein [Streptomyces sp. KM273126]